MSVYSQFEKLCRDSGRSIATAASEMNLNRATFTAWKRGAKPKNETLKKVADYFGVTVDWLLSDEDLPTKWEPVVESDAFLPLSSREKQILEMYRDLSEIGRLTVDTTILRVWNDER